MKTFYLIALAMCTSFIALSQVTITYPQNAPVIGSEYDYVINNDINQSYTSGFTLVEGANQTWDLSEFSGAESGIVNLAPSAGLDEANFPNADLLESATNFGVSTSETYYRYENGNYYIEGNYIYAIGPPITPVARIAYTDDRVFSKYPLSLGDTENDSFGGVFENIIAGQNFDRSGEVALEADGYGSVILPYGTVDNVLRVKVISNYSDVFSGQTLFNYFETQYLWYQEETSTFLASYNELFANDQIQSRISSYLSEEDFLSVQEELVTAELSVYPNPSADVVNVEFPSSKIFNYTIADAQGKTVITGTTEEMINRTLNINGLETGMYILHASDQTDSFVKRFIIE